MKTCLWNAAVKKRKKKLLKIVSTKWPQPNQMVSTLLVCLWRHHVGPSTSATQMYLNNFSVWIAGRVLDTQYLNFIKEYRDMRLLEIVTLEMVSEERSHYLNHNSVLRDRTRLKLLWRLYKYSNFTDGCIDWWPDLFYHVLMFRCYPIGIAGNIAKMYCQVDLNKEDKEYHQCHWRHVLIQAIEIRGWH